MQDGLAPSSVILSRRGKELFFQPQIATSGNPLKMSLGWHIDSVNGVPYFFKEGGGMGFHAEVRIYPSKGKGSVLLANNGSFNTRKNQSILDSTWL